MHCQQRAITSTEIFSLIYHEDSINHWVFPVSASGNTSCCSSTFHCHRVSPLDAAAVRVTQMQLPMSAEITGLRADGLWVASACSTSAARLIQRLHFSCTLWRCVLAEKLLIRSLQGYQLGETFHCTECWLKNDHARFLLLSLSFFS